MKKLIIGRNNECDIIIPDTTDLVSRKQAVLSFSFFGRMVLYDTSINGTYVNGQRLENGKGLRVTRKDKINFARIADLDWNEIKDPYRKIKIIIGICSALLIVAVILFTCFFDSNKDNTSAPEEIVISSDEEDTVATIQPVVVEEQPQQYPSSKRRKKINTSKTETPIEINNKEINDNSPIVY